jgi:hypothetical protein
MSNPALAILIGSLTSGLIAFQNANAQETFDPGRFSSRLPANARQDAGGLPRSGALMRSFEIAKDGVVTPSEPLSTSPVTADLISRTDGTTIAAIWADRTDKNRGRESDQYGLPIAVPSNPECGPSRLAPKEIEALVIEVARRHSVDPQFATAVAWTESRYDQVRNSPKGARGPMQLMPATAQRFGVTDVCDPGANIEGGVRYLRVLLDEFKNPLVVAAAYNAGEQAIYDKGGIPAYPETVAYVASVINHQFGISFPGKRRSAGAKTTSPEISDLAPSVIGARPPKFVGGVMQF